MFARRVIGHAVLLTGVLLLSAPALTLAQEPIDQPARFAEVRQRFEGMKPADWEAAGYEVIPPGDCIASPAGGMGVHAINPQLHEAQFQSGDMDRKNPPLILLDATMTRVIGLEWEAADTGQEAPTLFGQTVPLLPGHPGIPEPHYMLHGYFRPNDQVLFAEFDPQVSCELPPTSTSTNEEDASAIADAGVVLWGWFGLFGVALVIGLHVLGRRRAA